MTNDIGLRLSGTPNAERAAQYLADELRAIPGVEVDLQRVSDAHHLPGTFVPWPIINYAMPVPVNVTGTGTGTRTKEYGDRP